MFLKISRVPQNIKTANQMLINIREDGNSHRLRRRTNVIIIETLDARKTIINLNKNRWHFSIQILVANPSNSYVYIR